MQGWVLVSSAPVLRDSGSVAVAAPGDAHVCSVSFYT